MIDLQENMVSINYFCNEYPNMKNYQDIFAIILNRIKFPLRKRTQNEILASTIYYSILKIKDFNSEAVEIDKKHILKYFKIKESVLKRNLKRINNLEFKNDLDLVFLESNSFEKANLPSITKDYMIPILRVYRMYLKFKDLMFSHVDTLHSLKLLDHPKAYAGAIIFCYVKILRNRLHVEKSYPYISINTLGKELKVNQNERLSRALISKRIRIIEKKITIKNIVTLIQDSGINIYA